jgi:hypothetical protein
VTSRLVIALDTPSVKPGGWVRGWVHVLEDARSRRLLVRAVYRERTRDRSVIARTVDGPVIHEGDLSGGSVHEFAVQLPPDALPGCESKHGRLWWELVLESDRLGLNIADGAEFEVQAPGSRGVSGAP